MDEQNQQPTPQDWDPWDQGRYETGRTKPPKSHSGLIALLLAVVIVLCGLLSVLSIMNIRFFVENTRGNDKNTSMYFHRDGEAPPPTLPPAQIIPDAETTEPSPTELSRPGGTTPQLEISQSPASVENIPQEGGLSLQEIYVKAIDSVVSISCSGYGGNASGTGVILSKDGYIVTNCHVVENAAAIQVELSDDRIFPAQLIGSDAVSDLAVLYIDADGLTPAEFGDSGALRVGDAVAAIGDPLGAELRGTMTNGIVSAINRDLTTGGRTMTLIQTNAALNEGNSGGPLLNCYGQVVGINTMKIGDYVSSAGVEGLGFAIPSTTVQEIVNQLITNGFVAGRPSIGLVGETISSFYQLYYRLPAGLLITEVDPDSDAAEVGIVPGDILISLDGTRVTTMESLTRLLYSHEAGDTVQLIIYRSGRQYAVDVTLGQANG